MKPSRVLIGTWTQIFRTKSSKKFTKSNVWKWMPKSNLSCKIDGLKYTQHKYNFYDLWDNDRIEVLVQKESRKKNVLIYILLVLYQLCWLYVITFSILATSTSIKNL